ncbi:MAG: hypothetical protein IPK11_02975 [Ignavibacteria bacterium]|jgi:ligand-binding sensor domain-containing protein|nr:hypothetical protein [Ignavibacteria bacterium]
MSFNKVNSLIIIFLTTFVVSCKGQVNRNEKANSPLQSVKGIQNSNMLHKPKIQISGVILAILQDSKGNIWFGTQNGVFKQHGDSIIHIDSIEDESGKGVTVEDIAEDKDGRIWFAHRSGISSIDGTLVTNYYESDGLIINNTWCIETDVKGNVWIGTIEGACIFDGQRFTKFNLPEGQKDTTLAISSTKMVHNILEDSKGTMWFSTNAGLFSYTNKKLKNISEELGIPTSFISKIVEDKKDGFYVSTSIGLFHFKGNILTNISEKHFNEPKGTGSIIVDHKGDVWFNCGRSIYSLSGNKLTEYRIEEGNYGPLTFQIYEDQQNRLWFVGFSGAYRLENGRFINITKDGPW